MCCIWFLICYVWTPKNKGLSQNPPARKHGVCMYWEGGNRDGRGRKANIAKFGIASIRAKAEAVMAAEAMEAAKAEAVKAGAVKAGAVLARRRWWRR